MSTPNPIKPDASGALILTLELDPVTFAHLDGLRRAHFPSALNHIPAHLTLFHQLPGDRLDAVAANARFVAPEGPIPLEIVRLRLLGRGVAYDLASPLLIQLHRRLAEPWMSMLTAQDRQKFNPHVTIQNKTSPEAARALRDELARGFQPMRGQGLGVLVWRYLGGPWRLERRIVFGER